MMILETWMLCVCLRCALEEKDYSFLNSKRCGKSLCCFPFFCLRWWATWVVVKNRWSFIFILSFSNWNLKSVSEFIVSCRYSKCNICLYGNIFSLSVWMNKKNENDNANATFMRKTYKNEGISISIRKE